MKPLYDSGHVLRQVYHGWSSGRSEARVTVPWDRRKTLYWSELRLPARQRARSLCRSSLMACGTANGKIVMQGYEDGGEEAMRSSLRGTRGLRGQRSSLRERS